MIAARLLKGIRYLRDPGYSIGDVSERLGYRQPRILTTHMREVLGVTPSGIRARPDELDAVELVLKWTARADAAS